MSKKNILFLFPDQHRREWFPYSDDVFEKWDMKKPELKMPNVQKIMDRGVTFLNAITPSPLCAPARACLASGTRYYNCETPTNREDYPAEKPTFYNALKNVGYEVMGVGKFDLRKRKEDWFDVEKRAELGFTKFIDSEGKLDAINSYLKNGGPRGPYMKFLDDQNLADVHANDFKTRKNQTFPTPLSDDVYCDNWIGQNALDLISSVEVGKPWFMQVNFNGPHSPFDVTEKMFETVKNKSYELAHDGIFEENAEEIRQCYAAMIENIDRNIGMILDLVERRGEIENTVIVYASDHGEMLGDHGRYSKSVPYRGSIDIPFVISIPNMENQNTYNYTPIELQDLTNTFVQIAGADMPEAINSISLLNVLNGSEKREYTYSSLINRADQGFECVVKDDYKYIEYVDGRKVLYNIKNDPWEDVNVIDKNQQVAKNLEKLLKIK